MSADQLTIQKLFRFVILLVSIGAHGHLLDSLAVRQDDGCQLEAEQLEQLVDVPQNQHIENDDESHFVGEREVVAHRDVNILLDVDAAVAVPPDSTRLLLQLLILSVDDRVLFTRVAEQG